MSCNQVILYFCLHLGKGSCKQLDREVGTANHPYIKWRIDVQAQWRPLARKTLKGFCPSKDAKMEDFIANSRQKRKKSLICVECWLYCLNMFSSIDGLCIVSPTPFVLWHSIPHYNLNFYPKWSGTLLLLKPEFWTQCSNSWDSICQVRTAAPKCHVVKAEKGVLLQGSRHAVGNIQLIFSHLWVKDMSL
jgi:hypothetical protein